VSSPTWIFPNNRLSFHSSCNGALSEEESLIEWSKQFCDKDKIVLDIGSHCGTYSLSLAPHSKSVYAFEPQRLTYYALCGGVALSDLSNVYCNNCAIGSNEQRGTRQLKVISHDGGGSSILDLPRNTNSLSVEDIQVKSLDIDFGNLRNIGFVKVDVEGNEHFVFEGAREIFRESQYPCILFESNIGGEFDELNRAALSTLYSMNYDVVDINGYAHMKLAVRKT
jgi:FkbM family methyltransferase